MKKTSTNMGDEGFKLKTISTYSNKSAYEAIKERQYVEEIEAIDSEKEPHGDE